MADIIDICQECGSPQSPKYAPGSGRPCGWCGGTTITCRNDQKSIKRALAESRRQRGFGVDRK